MSLSIEQPNSAKPRGIPVPFIILFVCAVVAGTVVFYLFRGGREAPKEPVLTQEARLYVRAGSLALSQVDMQAKESFAKHMLVEVTGKITNNGDRNVRLVEITCVFREPNGEVIMRERQAIVSPRGGGLKPGETKSFRLPFDTIPQNWNQTLPDLVIAQIQFQ